MDKLTLQGTLSSVNSILVELGLVVVAVATVKHLGAPCPPLFQWGIGIYLAGVGLFFSTLIMVRSLDRGDPQARMRAVHARVTGLLSTPTLLVASTLMALSVVA